MRREPFDYIPEEAREEVSELLYKALLWRGWDRKCKCGFGQGCHAKEFVAEIAEKIEKAGLSIMEYT